MQTRRPSISRGHLPCHGYKDDDVQHWFSLARTFSLTATCHGIASAIHDLLAKPSCAFEARRAPGLVSTMSHRQLAMPHGPEAEQLEQMLRAPGCASRAWSAARTRRTSSDVC